MNNYYLSKINQTLRKSRKRLKKSDIFYPRIEKVVDGYYLELWFSTNGCSFDKLGSCTMCNYGVGYKIENSVIIDNLKSYLKNLDKNITELMISPSGSLWDGKEVNNNLLKQIYQLANKTDIPIFMIETRIDTITTEKLLQFRQLLPTKKLIIETGLESSNQWILKYLINKNLNLNNFAKISQNILDKNIEIYVNISLGNAFLSWQEIINDTIKSINFAFKNGSSKVVLFPIHIKPNTFINWLYQNGFYQPMSLWLLVDVLNSVDKNLLKNIEIAWYKSYYEDNSKMVYSPTTCPKCRNRAIELLDEYRATCEYSVIDRLNKIECDCKIEYKEKLKQSDNLLDRTINIYKIAVNEILKEELDNRFIEKMRDEYVANF